MKKSFRIAVRAVIVNNGKVLLCLMGKTWGFPGGGVEWGENVYNTLNREIFEELGKKIEIGDLIFSQDIILEKNNLLCHTLELFFTIKNNKDFLKIKDLNIDSNELTSVKYFDINNPPDNALPKGAINRINGLSSSIFKTGIY